MTRGLVLGKFAPLHKGHQQLIDRSIATCDETVVLIYDSPEVTRIPLSVRASWIRLLYPTVVVVEGHGAPSATGRSADIMKLQEDYICSVVSAPITHFFSSEWYGDHVSRALGALDVRVDEGRQSVPISGTQLRADAWTHRAWVEPIVYRDLLRWIVLLGAESTGKSTLASALAREFGTISVPELGRNYWLQHRAADGTLTPGQLVELAQRHCDSEDSLASDARRFLFVDTDARITRQYARWYHGGDVEPRLERMADAAPDRYHLSVLCGDDIPYSEDGTRAGQARRLIAQQELRENLEIRGHPWIEVRGTVAERVVSIRSEIDRLGWNNWC